MFAINLQRKTKHALRPMHFSGSLMVFEIIRNFARKRAIFLKLCSKIHF